VIRGAAGVTEQLNIFSLSPWQRFGWIQFSNAEASAGWKFVEARLRGAQDFHHALYGVSNKIEIHKIVGYTQKTLEQLIVQPTARGFELLQQTGPGDGTVTVDSARVADILVGDGLVNVQRVSEKHGSLYADQIAKAAILDLVRDYKSPVKEDFYSQEGKTRLLTRADVSLDRPYFSAGSLATLTLDVRDSAGIPVSAEQVTIRVAGTLVSARRIEAQEGKPIVYRFQTPIAEGTYEVIVSVSLKDLPAMQVTEMFEVVK